jgi:hypothetical protein
LAILLSALLVVGGLGLWNLNAWARPVNFAYVFLSLFHSLVSFMYLMVYEWSITNQEMDNFHAQGPMVQFVKMILPLAFVLAGLALVYPVITLIVMLLPSTARALRGDSPAEEGFDPDASDGKTAPEYDERRWNDRSGQTTQDYNRDEPQDPNMTTEEYTPDKPPPG